MAEIKEEFRWKEEFAGIFDPEEVYKFCYDFWSEGLKYDIKELEYKYSESNGKKKWEIKWSIEKSFDEFTESNSQLKIEMESEEKEGVLPTGEKTTIKTGKVKVSFKGILKNKLDEKIPSTLLKFFIKNILYVPIYKKWVKQLYKDSLEFRENLRSFLGGLTV